MRSELTGYDDDGEPEEEESEPDEPPAELQAQWDAADEGDRRFDMAAEDRMDARADLPAVLWGMATAMNATAAAALREEAA